MGSLPTWRHEPRSIKCPYKEERKVAQYQTNQERGGMIRGIAAEEEFLYEIMLRGLVLTLTNLDDLLKIRDIQNKKKSG
jgi:hypothetical protein